MILLKDNVLRFETKMENKRTSQKDNNKGDDGGMSNDRYVTQREFDRYADDVSNRFNQVDKELTEIKMTVKQLPSKDHIDSTVKSTENKLMWAIVFSILVPILMQIIF